ncbi:unnamed protein product [Amoebophrya sp. A120]|nr:unnamed protein product [Amoebophrya sp. A120]|eukprot:GSA120T00018419001.1
MKQPMAPAATSSRGGGGGSSQQPRPGQQHPPHHGAPYRVERYHWSALSVAEFRRKIQTFRNPIVIEGMGPQVLNYEGIGNYMENALSIDFLRKQVRGNLVLTIRNADDTEKDATFSEFLAEFDACEAERQAKAKVVVAENSGSSGSSSVPPPSTATSKGGVYLKDSAIATQFPWMFQKHVRVPAYFLHCFKHRTRNKTLHGSAYVHPSLFLGNTGTKTALHVDPWPTNFWCYLVEGEKKWTLFHPDDAHLLHPTPTHEEPPFAFPSVEKLEELEKSHPPSRPRPRRLDFVLKAGEVLFNPAQTPHEVVNLSRTLMVCGLFIDHSNLQLCLTHTRRILRKMERALVEKIKQEDTEGKKEATAPPSMPQEAASGSSSSGGKKQSPQQDGDSRGTPSEIVLQGPASYPERKFSTAMSDSGEQHAGHKLGSQEVRLSSYAASSEAADDLNMFDGWTLHSAHARGTTTSRTVTTSKLAAAARTNSNLSTLASTASSTTATTRATVPPRSRPRTNSEDSTVASASSTSNGTGKKQGKQAATQAKVANLKSGGSEAAGSLKKLVQDCENGMDVLYYALYDVTPYTKSGHRNHEIAQDLIVEEDDADLLENDGTPLPRVLIVNEDGVERLEVDTSSTERTNESNLLPRTNSKIPPLQAKNVMFDANAPQVATLQRPTRATIPNPEEFFQTPMNSFYQQQQGRESAVFAGADGVTYMESYPSAALSDTAALDPDRNLWLRSDLKSRMMADSKLTAYMEVMMSGDQAARAGASSGAGAPQGNHQAVADRLAAGRWMRGERSNAAVSTTATTDGGGSSSPSSTSGGGARSGRAIDVFRTDATASSEGSSTDGGRTAGGGGSFTRNPSAPQAKPTTTVGAFTASPYAALLTRSQLEFRIYRRSCILQALEEIDFPELEDDLHFFRPETPGSMVGLFPLHEGLQYDERTRQSEFCTAGLASAPVSTHKVQISVVRQASGADGGSGRSSGGSTFYFPASDEVSLVSATNASGNDVYPTSPIGASSAGVPALERATSNPLSRQNSLTIEKQNSDTRYFVQGKWDPTVGEFRPLPRSPPPGSPKGNVHFFRNGHKEREVDLETKPDPVIHVRYFVNGKAVDFVPQSFANAPVSRLESKH